MLTMREAIDIVRDYGKSVDADSLIDCVDHMDSAYQDGQLTPIQAEAYLIYIGEIAAQSGYNQE